MTLAMLLVLISHHKGLTLLLIVVIALLFIALIPLVKKLLRTITIDPDFSDGRRQAAISPRFRFAPHQPRPASSRSKAHKRNENHYQTSCANVSAQQNARSKKTGGQTR
jgi:hypothetical protein